MHLKPFRLALCVIAATNFVAAASAQKTPEPACQSAMSMKAGQLHGEWAVRFSHPPAGWPETATLRLERHAEFSESLAGTVNRDLGPAAGTSAIAGDRDEGMLLLDESSDRISITGTWNGAMVADSCGKVYQGVWKDTSSNAPPDAPDVSFTLTKRP